VGALMSAEENDRLKRLHEECEQLREQLRRLANLHADWQAKKAHHEAAHPECPAWRKARD